VIPNTWPVDMTKDPGEMFYDAWRFLLLGNWGSPPIEWADYVEAGTYVQNHAVLDGGGNPCLYGPDALIVAGPWLAEHPRGPGRARGDGPRVSGRERGVVPDLGGGLPRWSVVGGPDRPRRVVTRC
jgi:hypothetical protein